MFGVEPLEPWSKEDIEAFEQNAAADLRQRQKDAFVAAAAFVLIVVCIIPFSAGHPLNRHWGIARYLVWGVMALWGWLVIKVGLIWASWQTAREMRKEYRQQ